MPLVPETININDTSIYLWEIEETKDELISLCHDSGIDTTEIENIKSYSRACEKLSTLLLINHIFGKGTELYHTEIGAPRIKDSDTFISISHSSYLVGIAVSNLYQIGLDIEHKADQVLRVREKFLNDTELAITLPNDKVINLYYWTAKEAVYKAVEAHGIDFRNDIYKPISYTNTFVAIKDKKKHHFKIRHYKYDSSFMITIATPKIKNNKKTSI
jgi:phosphopantetheinyl transferase